LSGGDLDSNGGDEPGYKNLDRVSSIHIRESLFDMFAPVLSPGAVAEIDD